MELTEEWFTVGLHRRLTIQRLKDKIITENSTTNIACARYDLMKDFRVHILPWIRAADPVKTFTETLGLCRAKAIYPIIDPTENHKTLTLCRVSIFFTP
jgi:hypothetical protein